MRRNHYAIAAVALSTLAILIATLHVAGEELPPGWSLTITDGEDALAGLIQNLLLFIPLGVSLVLAGVRPLVAITLSQRTISDSDPDFALFLIKTGQALRATVAAASRPPGRDSPLVVILDTLGTKLLILGIDGRSLVLHYHIRALALTLEHP